MNSLEFLKLSRNLKFFRMSEMKPETEILSLGGQNNITLVKLLLSTSHIAPYIIYNAQFITHAFFTRLIDIKLIHKTR